jgi:hypothetical protein
VQNKENFTLNAFNSHRTTNQSFQSAKFCEQPKHFIASTSKHKKADLSSSKEVSSIPMSKLTSNITTPVRNMSHILN